MMEEKLMHQKSLVEALCAIQGVLWEENVRVFAKAMAWAFSRIGVYVFHGKLVKETCDHPSMCNFTFPSWGNGWKSENLDVSD